MLFSAYSRNYPSCGVKRCPFGLWSPLDLTTLIPTCWRTKSLLGYNLGPWAKSPIDFLSSNQHLVYCSSILVSPPEILKNIEGLIVWLTFWRIRNGGINDFGSLAPEILNGMGCNVILAVFCSLGGLRNVWRVEGMYKGWRISFLMVGWKYFQRPDKVSFVISNGE